MTDQSAVSDYNMTDVSPQDEDGNEKLDHSQRHVA